MAQLKHMGLVIDEDAKSVELDCERGRGICITTMYRLKNEALLSNSKGNIINVSYTDLEYLFNAVQFYHDFGEMRDDIKYIKNHIIKGERNGE